MSLSTDARLCGAVYVIHCSGRITTDTLGLLEMSIGRALLESRRLVLDLGGVTRMDSSGIGLFVRYLSHTRSRGGDLRLSTAPPLIAELLRATRLTTVFKVYDSEEEAILTFLKEPALSGGNVSREGRSVLFVDRSSDLCAFARALLDSHGYNVASTCRTHDAKLLLLSSNFDYVILGPESSQGPSLPATDILKSAAQKARVVQLPPGFSYDDPQRAGAELLRMLEGAKSAGAQV